MVPAEAEDIVSFPSSAKPVFGDQFIEAMGRAATGVTIFTIRRASGGSQ